MYRRQIPVTRFVTVIILMALLILAGPTPRVYADAGIPGWRRLRWRTSGCGGLVGGAVVVLRGA